MSRDWPKYLRSLGLRDKPKSKWPISIIKEMMLERVPKHIIDQAWWCDDDDELWVQTVQMYLEWENGF